VSIRFWPALLRKLYATIFRHIFSEPPAPETANLGLTRFLLIKGHPPPKVAYRELAAR